MGVTVIIPARYGSSRFPGKPLAPIAGMPMIERMWRLAMKAEGVSQAIVATDDPRIFDFVEALGGTAVMTPVECRNGTERVLAAAERLDTVPEVVINLQGDAVLTPPWVIGAVASALLENPALPLATPATRFDSAGYARFVESKAAGDVGGTTVTFDRTGRALYFSKSIIPFLRSPVEPLPVWRHIGLYGYRIDALRQLCAWEPTPLELTEQLEQLRALENGMPIQVVPVDYRGRTHWSVDSPADVTHAEALIAAEGELL